jgi:hypothetical protein
MKNKISIIIKDNIIDSIYSEQQDVKVDLINLDKTSHETLAERAKRLKAEALVYVIKQNNKQLY